MGEKMVKTRYVMSDATPEGYAFRWETSPDGKEWKSLMEGKPIPPTTPFGKAMMQLADRLGGRAEGLKKSSSLGGLFGLFSKTSKP